MGGMCGRGCMAGHMHGEGHAWWGACMVGGMCGRGRHVWQGGMYGRGHPRQEGACVAGVGVHGRGCVWWMACMAGCVCALQQIL